MMPTAPLQVLQTTHFVRWFASLRGEQAKARILVRIRRLSLGNVGDSKGLGGGISELRIDYGPGYPIYFARRGETLVLLLTGGDKSRQQADIARARAIAADWKAEDGH